MKAFDIQNGTGYTSCDVITFCVDTQIDLDFNNGHRLKHILEIRDGLVCETTGRLLFRELIEQPSYCTVFAFIQDCKSTACVMWYDVCRCSVLVTSAAFAKKSISNYKFKSVPSSSLCACSIIRYDKLQCSC